MHLGAHSVGDVDFSYVYVFYLFAQGHATAQSAGEPDDFGHKSFEGEIFLQNHSSQNGLHLWNTRTCRRAQLIVSYSCYIHWSCHLTWNEKVLLPKCQTIPWRSTSHCTLKSKWRLSSMFCDVPCCTCESGMHLTVSSHHWYWSRIIMFGL